MEHNLENDIPNEQLVVGAIYDKLSIATMPRMSTLQNYTLNIKISDVCILKVTSRGFRCITSHSINHQCGNAEILNVFFSEYDSINRFWLSLILNFNEEVGEFDMDWNMISKSLFVIIFIICIFVYLWLVLSLKRFYVPIAVLLIYLTFELHRYVMDVVSKKINRNQRITVPLPNNYLTKYFLTLSSIT